MSDSFESSEMHGLAETAFVCPHCQAEVSIPADRLGDEVHCLYCGESFLAQLGVSDPSIQQVIDDTAEEATEAAPQQEVQLDANRIRQLASLRRSLYRSRSYAIVGVITCFVTGIQLTINAYMEARDKGISAKPLGLSLCAIVLVVTAMVLLKKARHIQQEIRLLHHPDVADGEPDFSKLSDGSQRWKHLEDMTPPNRQPPD